jgi:hypothetical protein
MAGAHRVFVHRSTDPHAPKFSIHDLSTGAVTERDEVWLSNAVFEVSPAGRYRAIREHRRTVHAGVFGTLLPGPPSPRAPHCNCQVRYRLSDSPFFLNEDYRPVHEARLVHFIDGQVYVPREARWL